MSGWERVNRNSESQFRARLGDPVHISVPIGFVRTDTGIQYVPMLPGRTYRRNGLRDVDVKRIGRKIKRASQNAEF